MAKPFRCALLLFLAVMLPLTVSAHPGKTDSSGGHTDHSTGEYHYHHGYSAHQHYDMDGDGKADCPYDFKDNTNRQSGYGNSGKEKTTYSTSPTASATEAARSSTAPTTPKNATEKEETKPMPSWMYWCFGIFSAVLLGMGIKIRSQKEDMEIMKSSHSSGIQRLREQHEQQLHAKKATDSDIAAAKAELEKVRIEVNKAENELRELIRKTSIEEQKKAQAAADRALYRCAPVDVTFAKDGKPVYWKPDKNKPYGDYTVYVKRDSAVYHTDRICASFLSREAHIFDYIEKRRPCQKCSKNAFDFTKVPEWYSSCIKVRLSDQYDQ